MWEIGRVGEKVLRVFVFVAGLSVAPNEPTSVRARDSPREVFLATVVQN